MDENSHGSVAFASDIASHKYNFLSAPNRISDLARGEWRRGKPAAEIRGKPAAEVRGGNEQKGVGTERRTGGKTGRKSIQEMEVGSSISNEGGGDRDEEERREKVEFNDICMTTKAESRSQEKENETKVKREEKIRELERETEGRNKKDVIQEKNEKETAERREEYCRQAKMEESSPFTSWKKTQSLSPNPQRVHNPNKENFDHLQSVQTSLQVIYACGSLFQHEQVLVIHAPKYHKDIYEKILYIIRPTYQYLQNSLESNLPIRNDIIIVIHLLNHFIIEVYRRTLIILPIIQYFLVKNNNYCERSELFNPGSILMVCVRLYVRTCLSRLGMSR